MDYKIWYSPYHNQIMVTLYGRAINLDGWMKDCFFTYSSRKFSKTWVYIGEYE